MPVSPEPTPTTTPPAASRAPLDAARLAALLDDVAGLVVEVVAQTPSTNALAAERARAGAPDGLCVVAEHQSAGRGRLDRTWSTPRGTAVVFSLVLRPRLPAQDWPWLPLVTGMSVARTLRARGHDAGVKWPNDVLLGQRKAVGVLVERVETPDGPAAVLGVGVNVGLRPDELPVPTATSLEIESGAPVGRTDLLALLLRDLRAQVDAAQVRLLEGGAAALAEDYAAQCVTVGRQVRVAMPDGTDLRGLATGVDAAGRLRVRPDTGPTVALSAGDVVHVRPREGEPGSPGARSAPPVS